jgi:hypothetical protein
MALSGVYILVQRAVISAFQCTGDTEAGIRRFKHRFCRAECEMSSSLTSPFISPRACQSPRGESRAWRGLEERTWSRLNAARYRCTQSVCHVDLHCPVPFFHCIQNTDPNFAVSGADCFGRDWISRTFPLVLHAVILAVNFENLRCTWFKYGPSTCYVDRFLCLNLCVSVVA